jgi:hypothetical protein
MYFPTKLTLTDWNNDFPTPDVQSSEVVPDLKLPSTSSHNHAYPFSLNLPYGLEEQYIASQSSPVETETATVCVVNEAVQATAEEQTSASVEAFKMCIAELVPRDRNAVLSQAFQDCCLASADTSLYTVLVIRHIVELGWNPAPVLNQHNTSSFALPSMRSPETSTLLVDLGKILEKYSHCVSDIYQIHLRLANSVMSEPAETARSRYHDADIMTLLRQLWLSAHLQSAEIEHSVVHILHPMAQYISNRFCRGSISAILSDATKVEHRLPALVKKVEEDLSRLPTAVEVLSCLPRKRLSQYLPTMVSNQLRNAKSSTQHVWLELLHQLDLGLAPRYTPLVDHAMAALATHVFARRVHRVQYELGIRVLLSTVVAKAFRADILHDSPNILASFGTATEQIGTLPVDAIFEVLLSHLKKEGLPHEAIVQCFLGLVARHAGIRDTIPFLRVLEKRKLYLSDAAPMQQHITRELNAIRTSNKATEQKRQQNAFALHICHMASELLGEISSSSITIKDEVDTLQAQRQFAHILARAQLDHALPLAYRDADATAWSTDESVYLIHQLAHQYSTDYTRTQREAWRAMYYLYKYLRQNSLFVGPLFSKAVVRLSVVRPLSENRFVSARRLIWVCHVVARAEGEDVARQLEATFWQWRGDLLKHAKTVYVTAGGDRRDKVHINTMKRLGMI